MEAIDLTLRLQSDYRFRVPNEVRDTDALEEGSFYQLTIREKVDDSPAESNGALEDLIAEES